MEAKIIKEGIKYPNKINQSKRIKIKLRRDIKKINIKYLNKDNKKVLPNEIIFIYQQAIGYELDIQDILGYQFSDYYIKKELTGNVLTIELIYK